MFCFVPHDDVTLLVLPFSYTLYRPLCSSYSGFQSGAGLLGSAQAVVAIRSILAVETLRKKVGGPSFAKQRSRFHQEYAKGLILYPNCWIPPREELEFRQRKNRTILSS